MKVEWLYQTLAQVRQSLVERKANAVIIASPILKVESALVENA